MPHRPLWVFIDESGNFDFSPSGTRYFLMTAVVTVEPALSGAQMLALKYEQMLRGSNQLDFHAVYNSHGTRRRVFELIHSLSTIRSHTFVVDKTELTTGQQTIGDVLHLMAAAIAPWASSNAGSDHDHVTLVFDTAFTSPQSEVLKRHLKTHLSKSGLPYRIHFHRVANEPNGQIADYIAWAHFRDLERSRPDAIESINRERHPRSVLNE